MNEQELKEIEADYKGWSNTPDAVKINKLVAEVRRLREALAIVKNSPYGDPYTENDIDTLISLVDELPDIARNALKGGAS